MKSKDILVLGLGIEILTDDGIGSILTKIMSKKFKNSSITFKTNHVGGFDLLEIIDGYKTVVFIDAVKSNHDLPGKLVLYNLENYSETSHLSNRYGVSSPPLCGEFINLFLSDTPLLCGGVVHYS